MTIIEWEKFLFGNDLLDIVRRRLAAFELFKQGGFVYILQDLIC
jgi:hypothetical protein